MGGGEADFMIHGVLKYHLFGQELWITTTTIGMTIITLVLLILAFAANRAMKEASEVPGTFQNIIELGVEMLEKMTQGILGPAAPRFANYIGTIFLFILFCNLSGL
ncbi:MAG: F0F1 ATP synthase subunit A, partial [bacterium]|nr:F0F1 ATP synthase subunit A [bacterium]